MVNCAAIGSLYTDLLLIKKFSFTKFHQQIKIPLCKQWLHKIRREGKLPNDKSFYICSDHFQDKCYQRDLEVSLVKDIYPWSRFIFYYITMLYYATLSLLMNLIT